MSVSPPTTTGPMRGWHPLSRAVASNVAGLALTAGGMLLQGVALFLIVGLGSLALLSYVTLSQSDKAVRRQAEQRVRPGPPDAAQPELHDQHARLGDRGAVDHRVPVDPGGAAAADDYDFHVPPLHFLTGETVFLECRRPACAGTMLGARRRQQ